MKFKRYFSYISVIDLFIGSLEEQPLGRGMSKFRGSSLFRSMAFLILTNKEKIVNSLEIWEFLGKGWSDGNNN